MSPAEIEGRFISAVVKDDTGARWRDSLDFPAAAFSDYTCRKDWERIQSAPDFQQATLAGLKYFGFDTIGTDYTKDRWQLLVWHLERCGPHELDKVAKLVAPRSRFPAFESEPDEKEILTVSDPIIEGMLDAGDKAVFAAGSKSFKSWILIQCAYCIATGSTWLGMKTTKAHVLFLNFEIKPTNFWRRVWRVRRALGLAESKAFTVWNLRGLGFSMDKHADELIDRAKKLGARVIILDPIYKLFGDRNESSAGDMATLMALFDRVATETGAAIIFAHHFAKGSAAAKDAIDRASGSGVFARDPDCIITLTRLDEKEGSNTFSVSTTLREFAPIEDFAVRREHPIMVRADGVNVANLHEPNKRKAKYNVHDLVALLPDCGATASEWQRMAKDDLGMARGTFFEYVKAAKRMAYSKGNTWFRPLLAAA